MGGRDRYRGVGEARIVAQCLLDTVEFDPDTVDLDLAVAAPEKVDRAVAAAPHIVTGEIKPSARLARKGVGDELLRRQLRAVQIAERDTSPTGAQLTLIAVGNRR